MRFLIFLLVLIPIAKGKAQQADSLQSQPDSAFFPSVGLFQQRLFASYEHVPGQVLFHPAKYYSLSSVGVRFASGNWRTPQLPEKSVQYQIASRGISQINKFRLWGDFKYTRSQEDSVGWRLKADQADRSPYYLANIRPGSWDNHDYQLKGAGAVTVTEKLSLVAGAKLQVGTYGRFNDPRPEIAKHRLKLTGGVGYKVLDHVQVVLSGIYGYGEEAVKVTYDGLPVGAIPPPSTVTHNIMGYGFYRTASEYNLREDQTVRGGSIVLQAGSLNVAYTYQDLDREYTQEFTDGSIYVPRSPVGDLAQKEHFMVSSYTWQTEAVQHLLGAELQYVHLKDFNRILIQGNNFLSTTKDAALYYSGKRKTWEYGGTVTYQSVSRKDGTAAVDYLVQTATVKAEAQAQFPLKAGFLQVMAQMAYRTDLGSKLTIGSQYNDFMKGVVLPDFTYYSSAQLEPELSLGYGMRVKNVLLLPTFGYHLQRALSPKQFAEAVYTPGRTRSTYFLQLQVHL
ncbi:MAG: DUF6850 family outer membrane beta-barrel protein [Rufibacter sp.]